MSFISEEVLLHAITGASLYYPVTSSTKSCLGTSSLCSCLLRQALLQSVSKRKSILSALDHTPKKALLCSLVREKILKVVAKFSFFFLSTVALVELNPWIKNQDLAIRIKYIICSSFFFLFSQEKLQMHCGMLCFLMFSLKTIISISFHLYFFFS